MEIFLRRLLLRSCLTKAEQEAILALPGEEVCTGAHRDIVRPGQVTDFSCLVVNGLVGRFDQLANGHRQITALHIIGDFCDLHSLAVPESGWGLESLTDTTIRMVPHEALGELVESSPAFAMAFWRDTVVDSSILAKWNSALGRRSAKARLAHLLCEMGMRFEQAGLGEHHDFDFPITQAQLADVLGVTAVHLNRTMQALRLDELRRSVGLAEPAGVPPEMTGDIKQNVDRLQQAVWTRAVRAAALAQQTGAPKFKKLPPAAIEWINRDEQALTNIAVAAYETNQGLTIAIAKGERQRELEEHDTATDLRALGTAVRKLSELE